MTTDVNESPNIVLKITMPADGEWLTASGDGSNKLGVSADCVEVGVLRARVGMFVGVMAFTIIVGELVTDG